MDSAAAAKHEADMKSECQAMMAKKQETQDKIAAMTHARQAGGGDERRQGIKEVDAWRSPWQLF